MDEPISSVPMLRYALLPRSSPPRTLSSFLVSRQRVGALSFFHPSTDSRSICDLEGFRAEAGHYGAPLPPPPPLLSIPLRPSLLPSHGTQKTRGPILSAEKFIARSTLIGREIIGHSFPLSARSKRRSLIHDFSRIIAGPCLLPYPPPFLLAVRATVSPRISFPHPCSVPTKNSLIKTSFERASRFSNQR